MIINTGQRTDIPAFYSDWFANRLKAGYVCVRNPYDPGQVSRYRLDPSVVDVIGFCTKDPSPMFRYMDMLKDYGQYWFVTITPYGRDVEPGVPDKHRTLENFRKLSETVGINSAGWRYDPIFITDKYSADYHLRAFETMASELEGYTETAVISFLDLYPKVKRNFPGVRAVTHDERIYLGKNMVSIARSHGMVLRPCAEGNELAQFGADCSGCMTVPVYEKAIGKKLVVPKKKGTRAECACYLSCDIGAYDTCMHLCRYCYANSRPDAVKYNHSRHDVNSPFITGGSRDGDRVHDVHQRSWIAGQYEMGET